MSQVQVRGPFVAGEEPPFPAGHPLGVVLMGFLTCVLALGTRSVAPGRVVSVIDPSGATISYSYTPTGAVIVTQTPSWREWLAGLLEQAAAGVRGQ